MLIVLVGIQDCSNYNNKFQIDKFMSISRLNVELPPHQELDDTPSDNNFRRGSIKNRLTGAALLTVLFGFYWLYGWAGQINLTLAASQPNNFTSQLIYSKLVIFSAVFTIIGYALILSYNKYTVPIAFFFAFFIVSFTLIASPYFAKFWFNVLVSNFQGKTFETTDGPGRFYLQSLDGLNVNIQFYNIKISFANAISQLVALLGLFGKLNIPQALFFTFLYNFGWNLCHFITVLLQMHSPETRIVDDYQISNVYLFATVFSLIANCFLKTPSVSKNPLYTRESRIIALIGSFFVFLSFCTTTTFFPIKFTPAQAEFARSYIWQEAFLAIFFAMSSSVISSTALTVLFNGKTGVWEIILGIICGGIVFGPIAGTAVNIGAAITCGIISGIFLSVYRWKIHKMVNNGRVNDCYGALGVFIVSLVSTFGISPIILIGYYIRTWILPTLSVSNFDTKGLPLINGSIAGWVLSYVGVSIGVAIGSAFIAGIVFKLVSNNHLEGSRSYDFFNLEYGLTVGNHEIFEEDLESSSDFERIRKVIRDYSSEKNALIHYKQRINFKRQGGKLKSQLKKSAQVEMIVKASNPLQQAIESGIANINKNIEVKWGCEQLRDNFRDGFTAEQSNLSKFRALNHNIKTGQLEDKMNGSSIETAEIELDQRSYYGFPFRRVSIKAHAHQQDNGVAYLQSIKKNYDQLSLQITIKS